MRSARNRVRGQALTQMQALLSSTAEAQSKRAESMDGTVIKCGRFFHVKDSHQRMEFGSDRTGETGKDRPALALRKWRDAIWLGLPASWNPGTDVYRISGTDWAYRNSNAAPRDEFLFWWYERLSTTFLYGSEGDLRPETVNSLRSWLVARYQGLPERVRELGGAWEALR